MLRTFFLVLSLLTLSGCSTLPFFGDKNGKKNGQEGAAEPMVKVLVDGVDELVATNIKVHVGISKNLCTTPVDLLKRRNDKTLLEATSALHAFGYYLAEVQLSFERLENCPVATIRVTPGERMRINDIDILIEGAAAEDEAFKKEIQNFPVKQGAPLNHDDYRRTKILIESVAVELGYLDGRFVKSQLTIDMENYQANVILHYASEARYQLGSITIKQEPHFLDEDLVKRLLEVPDDSDYATGKVMAMQSRLLGTDYFKGADIKPHFGETQEEKIPLDVVITPSDKHKFSASVGFATDEGFRSKLGYTNRRFNPKGHQLGAEAKFSETELGWSSYYRIPRENPANEWLRFSAGVRSTDFDTYQTLSGKLTVSETKRRFWGIMEDHFVSITREDFTVGNESGISTFIIPGFSWDKRMSDNEIFTTKGFNINLDVRGATEALLSDTSYFRSRLHAHAITSLPFDMRAVARTELGWMWVDDFRSLPPSERFFAGGDNNLRGYDFDTLGPINDDGFVIGGSYLGIVSFELEKYLTDKWGVAAFVDSGNAFGGPGQNTGVKTGVGFGVRWRSPVGPVRVDLAHPLDLDDTWFRLHLRIGPDI